MFHELDVQIYYHPVVQKTFFLNDVGVFSVCLFLSCILYIQNLNLTLTNFQVFISVTLSFPYCLMTRSVHLSVSQLVCLSDIIT